MVGVGVKVGVGMEVASGSWLEFVSGLVCKSESKSGLESGLELG